MTERSYNQYCPIAHALDLVGERWALLIVRDLVVGPKRFVDLREGLPGIGTNILTNRLKALEGTGIITRRYLPPPAASTVYELTGYGRELGSVLEALARWGANRLGAPLAEQEIHPSSVMLAIMTLFEAVKSEVGTEYELRCTGPAFSQIFTIRITAEGPEVTMRAAKNPAIIISTPVEVLFNLVSGKISWHEAVKTNKIELEGDKHLIDDWLHKTLP